MPGDAPYFNSFLFYVSPLRVSFYASLSTCLSLRVSLCKRGTGSRGTSRGTSRGISRGTSRGASRVISRGISRATEQGYKQSYGQSHEQSYEQREG